MSGFLEIRDDEIDVEEIMRKIRENISKRKEEGAYEESVISKLHEKASLHAFGEKELDPQLDLEYLLDNWDIKNDTYSISSHRPLMGKILISGRKVVHGEVRRYVEPVTFLQSEFNGRVADFSNAIYHQSRRNKAQIASLRSEVAALRAETKWMSDMLSRLTPDKFPSLEANLSRTLGEAGEKLENKHRHAAVSDEPATGSENHSSDSGETDPDSMNYRLFSEEIGRAWAEGGGPCVNEPNVFEDSTTIFRDCVNVLDIGCGTGTFLKALQEADIGGYGIDLNEDYVSLCESHGFKVIRADAISHLISIDPCSLDGVFISQLVEHLPGEELLRMLRLCYEKMQYEGHIVIATPNIRSVLVSSNLFYLDPTHISHIHPEVLKFMLQSCGFREIEERYYQPVSDELKLKRIDQVELEGNGEAGEAYGEIVGMLNANIDKLNDFLFGFRDYCVIAKK